MRVAVDYDKTFTAHPGIWVKFMVMCQDAGWEVCVVTARDEELDWNEDFAQLESWYGIKSFFTDGKAKKPFMESLGIQIDIWCDDKPEGILGDSSWARNSPELAAWRAGGRK